MNTVGQTTAFFYTLTDAFCFVIIAILLYTTLIDADRNRNRWYQINLMLALLVFCLIDVVWIFVYEGILPRNSVTRIVSNVFLYCSINCCSFCMFLLLNLNLEIVSKRNIPSMFVPFAVFWLIMAVIVTTPWTNLLFTIDSDGVLHPELLYVPCMCVIIGDLILSSVRGLIMAFRPENETSRGFCIIIALYAIPVFSGGYIHLVNYEIPSVSIGLTISILLFYVMQMREQVSIDALTGINNRKQGEKFFLKHIQNINLQETQNLSGLYLFMIDVNKFKSINDTYGHSEGDNALIITAEALRDACTFYADKCMLCRFGGDEFVIGGMFESDELAQVFSDMIKDCVAKKCMQKQIAYSLSVSVGFERYNPEYKTFKALLVAADKKMYEQKKLLHETK